MNDKLIISTVIIALWIVFVTYCLFNGSKVKVMTAKIQSVYWSITATCVCVVLYLINGISLWCIILMIVMILSTILYISIPSGYNNKGIFIRGLFFPYSKIRDMKVESILGRYRLNFIYLGRFFYIDSNSYQELKDCEVLFKKER